MIDNDGRSKVTLFNDMQPENATSPIFVIDLKISHFFYCIINLQL